MSGTDPDYSASAWRADTGPRRRGCDIHDLANAINEIHSRFPAARLVRNSMGNLSVVLDETTLVGFLDLTFGHFEPIGGIPRP